MNRSNKLTLILLSVIYANANCTIKTKAWTQHPVHPIAQQCNENATRIHEYLENQGINLLRFSNSSNNACQPNPKEQYEQRIYILPFWLIQEKGSSTFIVFDK